MTKLVQPALGVRWPLNFACPTILSSWGTHLLRRSQVGRVGRSLASTASGRDGANCVHKPRPISLLIFHRHGDRSPLRGHTPDEELMVPTADAPDSCSDGGMAIGVSGVSERGERVATAARTANEFWRSQLVPPEVVQRLDKLYPVRCSPGEAVPPDQDSEPFGCLTYLGLQQLRERGERFRHLYSGDGIDNANLEVFSTNYRRTQLSAQGFLDGFLGGGGRGGVPVVVRPRANDFLNQWESRGHEMYERMMLVESEPSFQEIEEAVGGPLKRRLHALDPELFPLPQSGRFRWMMAADYFMTARARGLRVARELDALGTATIRHLVWRFSRFYRDKEMMRTMVGPLLAHIIERAAGSSIAGVGICSRTVPGIEESYGSLSLVVSSSCHDVTVLALLYAMGSHLIDNVDYWPPYGSTIAFAVRRSGAASGAGAVLGDQGEGEKGSGLVLDISVDGEPLRSCLFKGDDAISLSDFRTVLGKLLPRDTVSESLVSGKRL